MSVDVLTTPARPVPGTFSVTPANNRFAPPAPTRPTLNQGQGSFLGGVPIAPERQEQNVAQQQRPTEMAAGAIPAPPVVASMSPVERAAKTVNETLKLEAEYPELDTYLGQGISSAYDPAESASAAWAPFQKHITYKIPDAIFEQYNHAQIATMMGLFADLNHAWVSIDNAVYIWDYTDPNPELLGFEEQPHTVTAVAMITPKKGIFVPAITRLLVVSTVNDIILIGVSTEKVGDVTRLSLYQTKMSLSVRGLQVNHIAGSNDGRIFFAGEGDDDVYEITYQQEERWFYSRCSRINHTSSRIRQFTPSFNFRQADSPGYVKQLVVDNSKSLLYVLSSKSEIRVFKMKENYSLSLEITKRFGSILGDVGHMTSQTPLIGVSTPIVSIAVVPAQEASRFSLVATTSTGCRLYMSMFMSSSYDYSLSQGSSQSPQSIQVHHIKFPPQDPSSAPVPTTQGQALTTLGTEPINTTTTSLHNVQRATRYAPGFFFCLTPTPNDNHSLFISAPDTGRIAKGQEPQSHSKFTELSIQFSVDGKAEDIGMVTKTPAAANRPVGYANELAIQFDQSPADVAVMTNAGIAIYRRQRLVDIFFTAAKTNEGPEGREGSAKKFVRLYGRSETAATALAVACGEGASANFDTTRPQARDQDVQAFGRKVFIEHGGKPMMNENTILDQGAPSIDLVRPSPRHDGMALFMSRIVRAFWKSTITREETTPTGGLKVSSTIDLKHLRTSQERLVRLKEFLGENKSFIEGLQGPDAARNLATKQEEINLQAEHRALHALETLTNHVIEGISFVQVLFKERTEEIVMALDNDTRQQVRDITYEELFTTTKGRDIAKELVKAIVNRNIAHGANVDTVADALRRQCGRFCSAEDVVIFKAQEQIRRANEQGINTEFARNLLNESLRLYKQVAKDLPFEQLHWAVEQYVSAQFYAGAINLALCVAQQMDRGNRALSWIQDGRPQDDPRSAIFGDRKRCYDLIHTVIEAADKAIADVGTDNVNYSLINRRRQEAHEAMDESQDETFETDLYDWYLSRGQSDQLLASQSPFIVTYLTRRWEEDLAIADLLWRYHLQSNRPYEAAQVQLALAESNFKIPLDKRIEYLSRAKANAQIYAPGIARTNKQRLLHRISELLDIASIQDDVLQRLKGDARILPDRQTGLSNELGDKVLELNILFNTYADSAGYYDLCLLMYQVADYRVPTDIRQYWRLHLEKTHLDAEASGDMQPYEAVAESVRYLGKRMNLSEITFPLADLIPVLKRYALEQQRGLGAKHWVVDVFLDLGVPPENVFSVLEGMLYNGEPPFEAANRRHVAGDMLYVAQRWFDDTSRGPAPIMGSEQNANGVVESLSFALGNGMSKDQHEDTRTLMARITQLLR